MRSHITLRHGKLVLILMSLLTLFGASARPAQPPAPCVRVEIESPNPGDQVGRAVEVKGSVADPRAEVKLLVLDEDRLRYWLQQRIPAVNGQWQGVAYLGTKDAGAEKSFGLLATVGDLPCNLPGCNFVVTDLPRNICTSSQIFVTRAGGPATWLRDPGFWRLAGAILAALAALVGLLLKLRSFLRRRRAAVSAGSAGRR
jgi:hypothetical protein